MIKKTLGGDRLGSGNKMKAAMHNYERSTHDLGNVWRSSMAPGVLVPFYKKISTNGDTWSFNLTSLIRTMPAIGPLFGSYKLQMDIFECPIRLYNGILHNNMTKIGMDMSKVKLPKATFGYLWKPNLNTGKHSQVNPSSLMHYLGLKGLGSTDIDEENTSLARDFQIVPMLAYYDIFKNYYANKQEENAYVITNEIIYENNTTINAAIFTNNSDTTFYRKFSYENEQGTNMRIAFFLGEQGVNESYQLPFNQLLISFNSEINSDKLQLYIRKDLSNIPIPHGDNNNTFKYFSIEKITDKTYKITINATQWQNIYQNFGIDASTGYLIGIYYENATDYKSRIQLTPFKLDNIDNMRIEILRETALNTTFMLNEHNMLPYSANYQLGLDGNSGCAHPMAGLVLKTYQSDYFNNWLSQKWIDGVNSINEISAVAIEDGKFTIDALNLAKKVYNMLNRIAVSGGTYEDWQEAVYGEDAIRRAESPIYCGGASGIISFEEVVSTADTQTDAAGDQPLGSLAGKGVLSSLKGGNIEIHVKEPSYIIGIVSITPYIDYKDGNDFDLTELDSLNDIHKPELDEIGFQDLILEQAAWWTTKWTGSRWMQQAGGKQPAWIQYMTSWNEVHGDFCDKDNLGWMVLSRDYNMKKASDNNSELIDQPSVLRTIDIGDWTTYINPTKFNYQFANTRLDAQNFWVQIGINAICRRKISAKLIPNL